VRSIPKPPRRLSRASGAALAAALALAACRSTAPLVSEALPGVPVHDGAERVEPQPTARAGTRVERWRLRVPGGDEPARVATEREAVLEHYATALAEAGYAPRGDRSASLQLYEAPDGCVALVSAFVDPAEPDVLLVDLGRTTDGCAASSPAPR
jgi:hypothetical protein